MSLAIEDVDWEAMSWEERLTQTLARLDTRRRQIEKHKKTPEQKCIELHDLFQELAKATPWTERPRELGVCFHCGSTSFLHVEFGAVTSLLEYSASEDAWQQRVDDLDIEVHEAGDEFRCAQCDNSVVGTSDASFYLYKDVTGEEEWPIAYIYDDYATELLERSESYARERLVDYSEKSGNMLAGFTSTLFYSRQNGEAVLLPEVTFQTTKEELEATVMAKLVPGQLFSCLCFDQVDSDQSQAVIWSSVAGSGEEKWASIQLSSSDDEPVSVGECHRLTDAPPQWRRNGRGQ